MNSHALLRLMMASLLVNLSWLATSDADEFANNTTQNVLVGDATSQKSPLVATHNGSSTTFKILQFADLHFTGDPAYHCLTTPAGMDKSKCNEALTTKFMNDVLDVEKPDMVVFTGDNVHTDDASQHQAAIDAATNPVEARGIPWAMVFGNHDDENRFPREEQFAMAAAKKHSYIQHGPAEVEGVGNYELSVVDENSNPLLRLYFLDSHGNLDRSEHPELNGTGEAYEWIKPNQINYYKQLSNSHRQQQTPALMFFHIPLPEYQAESEQQLSGEQHEKVSSPAINSNLFSTLVEQDEVKAVFVGHDHVNEYCYQRQGIQLCYGGGSGFGRSYSGKKFARRVRVIEWTKQGNGSPTIRSWKRHHDSLNEIHSMEKLYPAEQ